MGWTTLTTHVTTPLFSAGADPENAKTTEIRVPSIRGVMRFWFRALAGTVTGTTPKGIKLMAAMERGIFGGPGVPSPCIMRIHPDDKELHIVRPAQSSELFRSPESRWILYLLGQGLADTQKRTVLRPYIAPGSWFTVMFRFAHAPSTPQDVREAVQSLALLSYWLTCTFGGIGARTRRGFGAVRITGAKHQGTRLPWDAEQLCTPGLSYYSDLGPLDVTRALRDFEDWKHHLTTLAEHAIRTCKDQIGPLPQTQQIADATGFPPFPVLDGAHTAMSLSAGDTFPSWTRALSSAGHQLRLRRATEETPEVTRYDPKRKTWEWLHVVNGERALSFNLAAFGLPVMFKPNISVNAVCDGKDGRRASMLWLRPISDPDGDRWRILSLAFLTDFLPGPGKPRVMLNEGRQQTELHVDTKDVVERVRDWMRNPIINARPGT